MLRLLISFFFFVVSFAILDREYYNVLSKYVVKVRGSNQCHHKRCERSIENYQENIILIEILKHAPNSKK